MHNATCSIWSRKVKQLVSGKTGAIHSDETGVIQRRHNIWSAKQDHK